LNEKVNKECGFPSELERREGVSKGKHEGEGRRRGDDHLPTKALGVRDEMKEWLPQSSVAVVVG